MPATSAFASNPNRPRTCQRDLDGDGLRDATDLCPTRADVAGLDTDGDGIGDACDACPGRKRRRRRERGDVLTDYDGDGRQQRRSVLGERGEHVLPDDVDGDGVRDIEDVPLAFELGDRDLDGDGFADGCAFDEDLTAHQTKPTPALNSGTLAAALLVRCRLLGELSCSARSS